jgi:glycosyltransferase involved in cell wall biosynthesis
MLVTVSICTWNRAKLLDQTLTRMHGLRIPAGVTWELQVVNNNCSNGTDEVIERHAGRLPLRRLFERQQGIGHARNCALQAAQGELLLSADDDVLVDPEWLAGYVRAAQDWPDAAYFAGSVTPWFETTPPSWIARNLTTIQTVYAINDGGPDIRPMRPNEGFLGASMAFRRCAVEGLHFDPELGRKGALLTAGEDTEFLERMRERHGSGVWVGTARARHFIPAARLTARYVWDWYYACARYRVQCMPSESFQGPKLWGVPRWVVGMYLKSQFRRALLSPLKNRAWLESFVATAHWRGAISYLRETGHPN